jgi:hypothetical protein
MRKIKNPFAFFGQKHERVKTQALFHMEEQELCACDLEGRPQAFFVLPVVTAVPCVHIYNQVDTSFLGSQKSVELIEHKPTLLLTHNA